MIVVSQGAIQVLVDVVERVHGGKHPFTEEAMHSADMAVVIPGPAEPIHGGLKDGIG